MDRATSRRNFLAAGLALPVAASASRSLVAGEMQTKSPAQGGLQYRVLGKTGLKVTTVGFGCMITSDPTVITRAVDMGINYFDSSRNYQNGQNERMVGAALGAKRKDIFLASKCDKKTADGILGELDTSLTELGTDHLDVWHLHNFNTPESITDELVEAQRKARQQGKIRFTGVSTHNVAAIADRIIEAKVEVVQMMYNFASPGNYEAALQKLHDAGVGLIAMKVMARGGGRRGGPPQPAKPPNYFPAALKWAINKQYIATTVPSMTDNDQLQQNFAVMTQKFSDEDSKILVARLEEVSPYFCRMCGQCTGKCPKGLPVSDMVRFVMYADGYGQYPLGRENFLKMPLDHQKVKCNDCATCAVRCPNGVRVAQQLRRAQELFA